MYEPLCWFMKGRHTISYSINRANQQTENILYSYLQFHNKVHSLYIIKIVLLLVDYQQKTTFTHTTYTKCAENNIYNHAADFK